ncbi:hypothetical protein HDE_09123 [Halotydeus destructor]|nr:hypothetical protein HDE_09123 [Halotydeus destructor]
MYTIQWVVVGLLPLTLVVAEAITVQLSQSPESFFRQLKANLEESLERHQSAAYRTLSALSPLDPSSVDSIKQRQVKTLGLIDGLCKTVGRMGSSIMSGMMKG